MKPVIRYKQLPGSYKDSLWFGDLQESVLRRNPDIVIATPGRLIDHLKNTPTFTLDSIEVLVLDEADRYVLFFRLCTVTGLCVSM
jgi:Superfamily II DNA and RNA helicases